MIKRTFYEVLNSNEYSYEKFQKLSFRMDSEGPQYKVVFGKKYSDPGESIEKGDFILKMFIPVNKEITDENVRKSILKKLFYNPKNF